MLGTGVYFRIPRLAFQSRSIHDDMSAIDLSQELGDGNEAEFQQYDCPMIQDGFWEAPRGGEDVLVTEWYIVFQNQRL